MKILKLANCKTDDDRWRYYTHVYAWRIFRGFAKPGEPWSGDPDCEWYDESMVNEELAKMREQDQRSQNRSALERQHNPEIAAIERRHARGYAYRAQKLGLPPTENARDLQDRWAQARGFAGFDEELASGKWDTTPKELARGDYRGNPDLARYAKASTAAGHWIIDTSGGLAMPIHPSERLSSAEKERRRDDSIRKAHEELGINVEEHKDAAE